MDNFNMDDLMKNLGMNEADIRLQTTVEKQVIEDIIVINAGKKKRFPYRRGITDLQLWQEEIQGIRTGRL